MSPARKAAALESSGLGHPFWSKREGGGDIQKRIKTQNQVLSNLVPVSHTYPGLSTVRNAWRCLAGKEKAPVLYSYLQTSQGAANMIAERDEWLEIRARNTVLYEAAHCGLYHNAQVLHCSSAVNRGLFAPLEEPEPFGFGFCTWKNSCTFGRAWERRHLLLVATVRMVKQMRRGWIRRARQRRQRRRWQPVAMRMRVNAAMMMYNKCI